MLTRVAIACKKRGYFKASWHGLAALKGAPGKSGEAFEGMKWAVDKINDES